MTHASLASRILFEATIAILEALRDTGGNAAPAGYIYAALQSQGCSPAQWEAIRDALLAQGLVSLDVGGMALTDKGREMLAAVGR